MLLSKGKIPPDEPWNILEVSMNQSPDVLALRIQKALRFIHEPAVEALVPFKRNVNGDPEWIVEHVYVRGANGSLQQLANTPGIDFIRSELADTKWIAALLSQEKQESRLKTGDFVRVLHGPCARLCGHVHTAKSGKVLVLIKMRTKTIRLHTYPANLQIVHCSLPKRNFFYQSDCS